MKRQMCPASKWKVVTTHLSMFYSDFVCKTLLRIRVQIFIGRLPKTTRKGRCEGGGLFENSFRELNILTSESQQIVRCQSNQWSKAKETPGLVPNPKFIRIDKTTHVSSCLNYHTQRVVASYWKLAFQSILLGWVCKASMACVNPRYRTACPMHIPYFKS